MTDDVIYQPKGINVYSLLGAVCALLYLDLSAYTVYFCLNQWCIYYYTYGFVERDIYRDQSLDYCRESPGAVSPEVFLL